MKKGSAILITLMGMCSLVMLAYLAFPSKGVDRVGLFQELIVPHTVRVDGYLVNTDTIGQGASFREITDAFAKQHPELSVLSVERQCGIYFAVKPRE